MKHLIGTTLLLALTLCSCSADLETQNGSGKELLSHSIVIGESGGFTGSNSGFIIDSTGLVKSFEGIITPDTAEAKGRLNEEQIHKINELIAQVLKTSYKEKGNLTSYITLSKDGNAVRYSWPGPSPNKNVPEPLSRFYMEVKSLINSL